MEDTENLKTAQEYLLRILNEIKIQKHSGEITVRIATRKGGIRDINVGQLRDGFMPRFAK